MAKYSDLKPGKEEMDLDELMSDSFDGGEMEEKDKMSKDIESALAPFSKEEIEAYLASMEGEPEELDEDMEEPTPAVPPTEVTGSY